MVNNFSFFGTDEFAVLILDELKQSDCLPTFIITTPDKPKGRHLVLTPPAVKVWAEQNEIAYHQPEKLKDFILPDCEVAIVASYGKILPASLLTQPKHGFVNIHPSLLPNYRGATPLQSAILSNDTDTGVTLMEVDAEMDHGAIIAQEKLPLTDQIFLELREQTAKMGAKLILEKLPLWLNGNLQSVAQDHDAATYTKKIIKEDGLLKDNDTPETNWKKFRAYTPWPGAYFFQPTAKGEIRVIIKKAHLNTSGELIIERVVPEGKTEMDYTTFASSC